MAGNLIEKSLKRYLKRKVKITLGLITAFLITGTVSFSAVEIKNENGEITVGGEEITGGTWTNSGTIKDDIAININKGLISGTADNVGEQGNDENGFGIYNKNNGILIFSQKITEQIDITEENKDLTNDGIIAVESGNGINIDIDTTSKNNGNTYIPGLGKIINNGVLSSNTGIGINMETLFNNGGPSGGGAGKNFGELINNKGVIFGQEEGIKISNNIKKIAGWEMSMTPWYESSYKNIGIISGEISAIDISYSTTTDNGGITVSQEKFSITNGGKIFSENENGINLYSYSNGQNHYYQNHYTYAVSSKIDVTDFHNSGIISGKNGINIFSEVINTLEQGETFSQVDSKITDFYNSGIILGKDKAVSIKKKMNSKDEENGTIENYKNYGIIAGQTLVDVQGFDDIKAADMGIAIKFSDNNGTIESVTAGTGGEIAGGDYSGYTVKNTLTEVVDIGDYNNTISSSDLDKTDKLIINGVNNALKFNQTADFTLTDSIINAYGTAVNFAEENTGSLTLNNVTVNGGKLSEKVDAVLGSSKDDTFILSGTSVVNGNINLGEGKDNLTLSDSTVVNSSITGNNDKITLDGTSVVNGDITVTGGSLVLGNTNARLGLFNTGAKVQVNGDVRVDGGNVTLGNNVFINGNLVLGAEAGSITVGKDFSFDNLNAIVNGKLEGTTNNKYLGLGYNVNTDSDTENFEKQFIDFKDNGFDVTKLQLADGGNNLDVSKSVYESLTEIKGGEGADNITIGSFNTTVTDNTSDDNDTLTLDFAFNRQEQTLKDKISGIENLQLSDLGNTINTSELPFTKYLGGKGADNFILDKIPVGIVIEDKSQNDGDSLKLTFDLNDSEDNLNSIVTGIEKLNLKDTGDTVDVSKLSAFSEIAGGNNGENIFNKVSVDDVTKVKGGNNADTINMLSGITDKDGTVFSSLNSSIEKIVFSGNNDITVKTKISADTVFGDGDNTVRLNITGNELGKELTFGAGNNIVVISNLDHKFDYKLADADEIMLSETGKEWKIENAQISGNTNFNLNSNTLVLNSKTENNRISLDNSFITSGNLTFSNGEIKIELAQDTDFSQGSKTSFDLDLGKIKTDTANTEFKTYAFLKIEDNKLKVIDWNTLSNGETNTCPHSIIYEDTLRNFQKDGINGALRKWEKDDIVKWITEENGRYFDKYIFQVNNGTFDHFAGGEITIDSSVGKEIKDMTFDVSAFGTLEIKNNNYDNGNIIFNNTTDVANNITNSSSKDIQLTFNGETTIGNIVDTNTDNGNMVIDINNKLAVGNIVFGNETGNKLNISDVSDIAGINSIQGKADINITKAGNSSEEFNKILSAVENQADNQISVAEKAQIDIYKNYEGTIVFKAEGNKIELSAGYTGNMELGKDSTVNINSFVNGAQFNTKNNIGTSVNIENGSSFGEKGLSLGSGDDVVTFNGGNSMNVVISGGKNDNDIFNIESSSVLGGKIKDFENININSDTKFVHNLDLTGTKNINIGADKTLELEIDYKEKDSITDKVIGHAFNGIGDIKVDNTLGKFYVSTAGANSEEIIDFSNVEFSNYDQDILSNSSTHDVEFLENGDIKVSIKEHIMGDDGENIKYAHLDKIYQSIVSAGKISLMAPSTTLTDKGDGEEAVNKSVQAQLEFYGKIYHSTPYAYSNEVSKKSAMLISESLLNNDVMPDVNKWVFGGSVAGQETDNDNNFYGNNYYGVDNTKAEVDIESSIYGAYAFGEYGIGENKSLGFAVAGTKGTTDISGGSQLKSNSIYVAGYAKQEINNLKLMAGIGYQHGFYDSTRRVSNDYQSMSVDKKYEDDLLTVFAGARYSYHLGNDFYFEPHGEFTVSHVIQDNINETDNGDLSIEVDSQDFTSIDTEIGADIVKKINLQKGILNLKAGVSLVYALDGCEEEYLTGRITSSSKDFEIISPEDDRVRMKLNIGTQYETEKGMFYNLNGNYITSSHDTEYSISFGAGYKF